MLWPAATNFHVAAVDFVPPLLIFIFSYGDIVVGHHRYSASMFLLLVSTLLVFYCHTLQFHVLQITIFYHIYIHS